MQSTRPIQVVSMSDPALDREKCDWRRYGVSRDAKHLVHKKDREPAVYHLRRIPRSLLLDYVQTAPNMVSLYKRAFECSVVQVDRMYDLDTGDQSKISWCPKWTEAKDAKVSIMDDEELERFPPEDVLEIGEVAHQHAFLRPGSGASYEVSPTVRSVLRMADRLPVDVVLREQGPPNEKQSEA